jgi:hypothetical protein
LTLHTESFDKNFTPYHLERGSLTISFKTHIDNAGKSEKELWAITISPVTYRKGDNAKLIKEP